ncbi:MAG: right-handed parallel beta-helix repeat-containing protein [Gammaproteobacteria bacterium]|nr:right-handed parallel beta-helix repeat-containing protein [Gammaproteobacteria bacterium]
MTQPYCCCLEFFTVLIGCSWSWLWHFRHSWLVSSGCPLNRRNYRVDTSQLVIKNCHISNFGANFTEHGVGFFNGAGGVVENCVIDNQASSGNNWSRGIYVANSSAPEIRENHIKNTGIGIVIWNSSPWVVGNLVERNVTGIYSYGDSSALINGQNVITENSQAGLEFGAVDGGVSPNCIVKNNNIFNNKWNVMTDDYDRAIELEVDVSGNWWGAASPSVVSSGIFDFKVIQEASPPVKVVPFLDAPNGNPVQGNFLNGRVDQDTTLLAGEAYTVVGSYVIIPNTKLTVQPGARLEFSSTALLYSMGDIDVVGTEGYEATFITAGHAGDLPVGGGVVISGVAEAAIEWAHFENLNWGLYILASEVVVKNSKFSNNQRASISASNSNVSIIDNIFERSGREFCDYGCIGVDLYGSGNVSIERNNFSGGNVGIFVSNGSPEIKENTITGNNYGISLDESGYASWTSPVITNGNVIANNDYGVYSNNITRGSVSVNGNNIHGNGFNYYKTRSSHVEDATNNWWGSAIESEIAGTIYTQHAGAVAYVPFLAGPAPIAPQLSSGAQYTAESAFSVTGSAQPGIQVRLYVNGVEHLVVVADQGGAFSGTVALDEGENHIHAEAFNQTTVSSASNSISVILDTIPPSISIARPFNGDRLNANPIFSGTVSEPVFLTIAGESVLVSVTNEFTHGPVRLSEGLNSIPIIAEDIAGNVTLQTIDLVMDTTPPENPDMNLVVFGPLLGGVVNVTGGAGAVEAGVQVYVANSRTGVVSMVVSNGDGGFSAVIDAQPGDALTLTVADDLGNQAIWNHEIIEGVPAALSISNVSPINGSAINGDRVTISGEFDGPEGLGIVVAGQSADLYGNRFVASDVLLSTGLNSIEITASSPDGQVYTHDLTLTSSGEIPFKVSVSPESGLLPYIGELIVTNETGQPMQSVEIDIDNDGVFDGSFFNLNYSEASWDIWYGTPGLHIGRVRIVDYAGVSHELSYGLMVEELVGKQSRLQMVYRNMMSNLASGNIEGASARIAGTSRERYDEIFTMLGSDLGAIAQDFGEIRNIVLGDGWAELLLVRESGGVKTAYRINLFQGEDGVWRIESM